MDSPTVSGPLRSQRFEFHERLGAGAFGEVFRVYDRQLKTTVALKALKRVEPAALYLFKKEFRALADVHHRNLVELYELLSVGDRWFFTMELVDGQEFLEYAGLDANRSTLALGVDPSEFPPGVLPLRRLRGALRQLAEGLSALHRSGRLHRDIKPSNVKVTPEGRLVLLDFGLVKELAPPRGIETSAGEVLGTPAYMSPEQALGRSVTEASDWYAVGCVLYEALTGQRPFSGSLAEILRSKQSRNPPAPRDVDPTLPRDLDALCRQLLAKNPAHRPRGEEILEQLNAAGGLAAGGPAPSPAGSPGKAAARSDASQAQTRNEAIPFVGREEEQAALGRYFERTLQGKAVAVFVRGNSGQGKSALVDRFIARLQQQHPELVVLTGRCYERESAPYKGLDPLIDALGGYLKQLPSPQTEALMPAGVWALARLFPALQRVPAVSRASREVLELPDLREQRRQARQALRELLQELAEHRPTLLYIDDLQWSDRDSAHLLAHVLGPPDPPAVLLLTCDRRKGSEEQALLYRLLASGPSNELAEVGEVEVGRLAFRETCELGRRLLNGRAPADQGLIRTLARESAGNPFFLAELVRHARSELGRDRNHRGSPSSDPSSIPLENLIWSRIERLTAPARRLMELVAVAGRPVAFDVVLDAADLGSKAQAAVTELLATSLVCLRGDHQQKLESYHDRIRETAVQGLNPVELAALHRQLATALQADGRADAETLAIHYHAAGEPRRAAELAVTAARRASEALAFDHAVRLYRLALDQQPADSPERHRLQVALADALAKVGRRPEAAEAYLEAAAETAGTEALELQRRAAVQQYLGGKARDAFATIRQLLETTGVRLPRTAPGVLASCLVRRSYLKLRGLRFREREASQIPPEQLLRVDACWSGAAAAMNPMLWMDLCTRHLLLALAAGEPRRIIRALLHQVYFLAQRGHRTRQRSAEMIQLASSLAKRLDDPYTLGLASNAAGLAAFFEGRWKRAGEWLDRSEKFLRKGLVDWEMTWVILWQLESLALRGRLRELNDRLAPVLQEATEVGNLLLEVLLRGRLTWLTQLAADRPEEASEELQAADRLLTSDLAFFRNFQLTGQVETALYRSDGPEAWRAIEKGWPALVRSSLLTIQLNDIQWRQLRCRAALAVAPPDRGSAAFRKLRRRIHRDVRRIEAQRLAWGHPMALLLRAGLETLCNRRHQALEHLAAAEAGFESADMELYAAVSCRRRGQLLGATEGARWIEKADRWMATQGVRNPTAMSDVLAPGSWG